MAGGICTARAHAAAAVVALCREIDEPDHAATVTVDLGRRTITFPARAANVADVRSTMCRMRERTAQGGTQRPS